MSRISIIYDDSISDTLCGKVREALEGKKNNLLIPFFSGKDIDIDFLVSFPDLSSEEDIPKCTFYAVATLWKTGSRYSIFPYDDPDPCCLYPLHKDFYKDLSQKFMGYMASEFLRNSLTSICKLHGIPKILVLKRKEIELTVCKVHFLDRLKEHKRKVEDNPEIFSDPPVLRETDICSTVSGSSALFLSFVSRSVSSFSVCMTVRTDHSDYVSLFEATDFKEVPAEALEKLQDRLKEFSKKILEECGLAISLRIVDC